LEARKTRTGEERKRGCVKEDGNKDVVERRFAKWPDYSTQGTGGFLILQDDGREKETTPLSGGGKFSHGNTKWVQGGKARTLTRLNKQ